AHQQQPGVPQPAHVTGWVRAVRRRPGRDGRRHVRRWHGRQPDAGGGGHRPPADRRRRGHEDRHQRRPGDRPRHRQRRARPRRHRDHRRPRRRARARPGHHLQAEHQQVPGPRLLGRRGRRPRFADRAPRGLRQPVRRHRLPGHPGRAGRVHRDARGLQDRRHPGDPAPDQDGDRRRHRRPGAHDRQPADQLLRRRRPGPAHRRPAGDHLQPGLHRHRRVHAAARLRPGRPGREGRRPREVRVVPRLRLHDHAGLALHRDPAPAQLLPRV
ncbi:MAG: Putative transmembrane protein, partial [uncultured Actinomycetospora sp.]